MKLSVVIPIYNEAETIPELRRRLAAACDGLAATSWQVIFVDDGSTDGSSAMLRAIHQEDPRFAVVELTRNFGHQAAITAGLACADCDAVVVMDGDLQDPPELIPQLLETWRQGAQVVHAERRSSAERGWRGWAIALFHQLIGWISDFPMPRETGVFGLLDREALHALRELPERNRFLPGLRGWIGFEQKAVLYDRPERAAGQPKQTPRRLVRYALDAVFGFSYKPLRLLTLAGAGVCGAGLLLAAAFIVKRLGGWETAATGFTTLVTLILLLGGAQLAALGLLGEYLGRVYDEVKQRPLYLIRRRHGLPPAQSPAHFPGQAEDPPRPDPPSAP